MPLDAALSSLKATLNATRPHLAALPDVIQHLANMPQADADVHRLLAAFQSIGTPQPYPEAVFGPLMPMKADYFEGIHRLPSGEATPHADVWNWRRTAAMAAGTAQHLPVYGVGQCNLDGLLFCLRRLQVEGFERVCWCNMRLEPVVYIAGFSCSTKWRSQPQDNITYMEGISGHELEAVDARLRDRPAAHGRSAAVLRAACEGSGGRTTA